MRFDLAALTRRQRNVRRSAIVIRDIVPPATLATDLYRSCYSPIVVVWVDAVERIAMAYERAIEASASLSDNAIEVGGSCTPNAGSVRLTDSPADLLARLNEAQSDAERLYITLDAALRDWALRVERWHRTRWRGAVLAGTGIDLTTMLGAADVRQSVDATIAWNTSLIRDVSEQARKRMADAVFAGVRERRPAREVAAQLREAAAMSRRRSVGIASDQMTKLTSSLAAERRRQAGIETWRWRHSGKLHPRADHKARDGREYTDGDAPKDLPGQLPYCGCREQAVVRFD